MPGVLSLGGLGIPHVADMQSLQRLIKYSAGDTLAGESFARAGATATIFDVNGVLQTLAANQKRDAHVIGGQKVMLLEPAGTNIVVSPRDLTNAAWVHTTMTPAKDQTGIDGVLNSASSILATGANATSLQTIVLGASTRAQQAWVKRLVGVGAVSMTMDNVTFTAIAVTGAWTKVTIPSQAALVNPVVGFKLATAGDQIAVDFVDNETGTLNTSPKIGTRNGELYGLPIGSLTRPKTIWIKFIELTNIAGQRVAQLSAAGNVTPYLNINHNGGSPLQGSHNNGGAVTQNFGGAAPVIGDTDEAMVRIYPDGSVDGTLAVNGGAGVTGAQSAANALAAAWSSPTFLWLGSNGVGNQSIIGVIAAKVMLGIRTLAEMRAA